MAYPNASHWGMFSAERQDDGSITIAPHPDDPAPSPLLDNIASSVRHPTRVAAPMVRKAWMEGRRGGHRRTGDDPFVAVSWDTAAQLVAERLGQVIAQRGNEAIFGGSYGWGSAGRFHHAQSQVHRFLNCIGGYTASRHSYSVGTAEVLLPHVVGGIDQILRRATSWPVIAESTELFVAFGGVAGKNLSVAAGGVSRHKVQGYLQQAVERGMEFRLISPLQDDLPPTIPATRYAIRPGTDTALMLALAYVLLRDGTADRAFLERYCVGFDRLEEYITGRSDGLAKDPSWAGSICDVAVDDIEGLARDMASARTMINVSWSLQRAAYGEQPLWMGIALAAMLGQIGLPGGGFGHGYGASDEIGRPLTGLGLPTLAQGENPVEKFIPVARFTDMLLHPGAEFEFNGSRYRYPEIELVYWCGGNPFHHQQDLLRLEDALSRPDTIIVHEPFWTPMARRADIVLPATITIERNDIGVARNDPIMTAMKQAVEPHGGARNDYDIFRAIAEYMGVDKQFSEGRDEMEWLCFLYEEWRRDAGLGDAAPPFEQFWEAEEINYAPAPVHHTMLADFRKDPDRHPLATPSGRIELFSAVIDSYGYDDCPGHPVWREPRHWHETRGDRSFVLIANNPATRLHSQLDVGAFSKKSKVKDREPLRMHTEDAARLGLTTGDIVLVRNDRGALLAGLNADDRVRAGTVQLSTGAWFDPLDIDGVGRVCVHGNPNAVTEDAGASRLSQGSSGQHALVEVSRWTRPLPELKAHRPPEVIET